MSGLEGGGGGLLVFFFLWENWGIDSRKRACKKQTKQMSIMRHKENICKDVDCDVFIILKN